MCLNYLGVRNIRRNNFKKEFEKESKSVEERIAHALARISIVSRHQLFNMAMAYKLSAIQAQILSLLSKENVIEIVPLSQKLGLKPSTVSDSVKTLEKKGLVKRYPLLEDKRHKRVYITEKGKEIGYKVSMWPDLFQDSISGLSKREKEILLKMLIRIIISFLKKGFIQEIKMCLSCTYFLPFVHTNKAKPHHCSLVNIPLGISNLRLDCVDYESKILKNESMEEIERWLQTK